MKINSKKTGSSARAARAKSASDITSTPPAGGVGAVAGPADSVSISGIPEAELTPRVRDALTALMTEVAQLRSEIGQLRTELAETKERADSDPLTNIANRRAFVRDLSRCIAMAERYQTKAVLVFIDLNDLKQINDTHGHKIGDAALQHVATIISANIRTGDSFGRLGGDEFGLILINAELEIAKTKIDQLSREIATTPLSFDDQQLSLQMACGLVEISPTRSVEETIEAADRQMYAQKPSRS